MTRSEVQQFFDRRIDAWRQHDVEALGRFHTDDCVLDSPLAGVVRGRSAIERVYRALFVSFPDNVLQHPDLLIDGDRAVQTVTLSGTNTGGFMGMPPTGKRF